MHYNFQSVFIGVRFKSVKIHKSVWLEALNSVIGVRFKSVKIHKSVWLETLNSVSKVVLSL